MQYALIDHKPVRAGDIAPGFNVADIGPSIARCPYCGEWVKLLDKATQPAVYAPAWIHSNPADEAGCNRDRARTQAELYQAIGIDE